MGSLLDVRDFVRDVLASRKIEMWDLEPQWPHRLHGKGRGASYGRLCEEVYRHWARAQGKVINAVVDKNNYYVHHIEPIMNVWPDAKVLHLIRDGRDVACSYKALQVLETTSPYKPDLPTDIQAIAEEWRYNNERIAACASLGAGRYLAVRYEDLLRDPENVLGEVCEFLGVDYDLEMLNYQHHNDEPELTSDWKRKTFEPLDVSNIGKYKIVMDEIRSGL